MADGRFKTREIALSGRLRTADDPTTIGPNDLSVCKNVRPADQYPRGIGGMTKINTAALASTGVRNGFHFRKSQPSEYHVLAWTSDGKVWVNDTAAPNQGAFDGTALFTDTAGGSTGRFSAAPGGALAYANGVDSCLWGGDQHRCAGFIDFPTTGQVYDYSDLITNTKTDAQNVATIHTTQSTIDAATMLLLHLDNNVTDSSPTTAHTVTNTNVTYSTSSKFGTHAAVFNGTTARLSIPDDADFDFSGGTFTIDFWMKATTWANGDTIFYQGTDATNYIKLEATTTSSFDLTLRGLKLTVVATTATVTLECTYLYPIGNWIHVAIVENGDSWYLFVDGSLRASVTDTDRAANYTGVVYIGNDGGTSWYDGAIDELRISNSARWTSAFSPPSSAYGPEYISTSYIGSIMPLDGVKFTVATANPLSSGTATMAMNEWDGAAWSALTITDNTAASSRSLEQTGTVTWTSTAATSKPTVLEKVYLYWYKMVISSASDFGGITISNVTVSIPFQAIKDIWDGEERPCNSFIVYDSPKYLDYTSNVLENGFSSTGSTADASTYASLVSLTTTDYLYAGFIERMAGITLYIIDEYGNASPSTTIMSWDYWNGSAWTPLNVTDGTMESNRSLSKSGWVTWPAVDRADEFKKDISAGSTKGTVRGRAAARSKSPMKSVGNMYYYRGSFSSATSNPVRIYHVAGIPAPTPINGYSFPMQHQNRAVLVNDMDGMKNSFRMSAQDTSNVFNGLDAYEYAVGSEEAIVAGASLFLRFGSSVQDMLLLGKANEIHLMEGNGSESDPYRARLLSATVGVRAPLTMTTVPVGDLGGGVRRQIAIWESQRGIEVFDGASLMDPLLSHDIRDKFDPLHANYAGSSSNAGFYDPVHDEYHWLPVGSAEWVFSFKYKKWHQVVRGTAKYLYGGIPVMDSTGNSYVYGFDNAGFVYRLDNGTNFDGNDIAHTLKTGAIALSDNRISEETTLRMVKVVQVAKNTTANSMTVTHFGDTDPTGNSIGTIAPAATKNKSGVGRLRSAVLNAQSKQHVHHEFQLALTTDDEASGCEPIYIVAYYDGERQDVR